MSAAVVAAAVALKASPPAATSHTNVMARPPPPVDWVAEMRSPSHAAATVGPCRTGEGTMRSFGGVATTVDEFASSWQSHRAKSESHARLTRPGRSVTLSPGRKARALLTAACTWSLLIQ